MKSQITSTYNRIVNGLFKERNLFLVGGLLACVTIGHWLTFPVGVEDDYRNVYHMISSVQGFLTCLVAAACFYFLPIVVSFSRPTKRFLLIGCLAPVGTTLSAWLRFEFPDEIMLAASMIFWGLLVIILLYYCLPLFQVKSKRFKKLNTTWLISGIVFGLIGTCLVSTYSTIQIVTETEFSWILFLGRGYLLQSMMLAVYVSVIPLVMMEQDHVNYPDSSPSRNHRGFQLLIIAFLTVSFPLEFWISTRLGFAIRTTSIVVILLKNRGLRRLPIQQSLFFKLIWLATWLLVTGYVLPIIDPEWREVGLHVVFIGGFVTGSFSMILLGIQKCQANDQQRLSDHWSLGVFPGLLLFSLFLRITAEFYPADKLYFLSISAWIFVLGALSWMVVLAGVLRSTSKANLPHSQ